MKPLRGNHSLRLSVFLLLFSVFFLSSCAEREQALTPQNEIPQMVFPNYEEVKTAGEHAIEDMVKNKKYTLDQNRKRLPDGTQLACVSFFKENGKTFTFRLLDREFEESTSQWVSFTADNSTNQKVGKPKRTRLSDLLTNSENPNAPLVGFVLEPDRFYRDTDSVPIFWTNGTVTKRLKKEPEGVGESLSNLFSVIERTQQTVPNNQNQLIAEIDYDPNALPDPNSPVIVYPPSQPNYTDPLLTQWRNETFTTLSSSRTFLVLDQVILNFRHDDGWWTGHDEFEIYTGLELQTTFLNPNIIGTGFIADAKVISSASPFYFNGGTRRDASGFECNFRLIDVPNHYTLNQKPALIQLDNHRKQCLIAMEDDMHPGYTFGSSPFWSKITAFLFFNGQPYSVKPNGESKDSWYDRSANRKSFNVFENRIEVDDQPTEGWVHMMEGTTFSNPSFGDDVYEASGVKNITLNSVQRLIDLSSDRKLDTRRSINGRLGHVDYVFMIGNR